MAYLRLTNGKDFELLYSSAYGVGVNMKIKYGGVSRELSQETYDIIEKKMIDAGETGTERNGAPVYNITHDEVKGYYLNELPPVEVTAPAEAKTKRKTWVAAVAAAVLLLALLMPKKGKK